MYYIAKIEGKRLWDDPKDIEPIIKYLTENKDSIDGIELSSNSIGIPCSEALANAIISLPKLTKANYRDIFVSRLKEDLPISLEKLMKALIDKPITLLDLSDNAFGPAAVHSFDFFLKSTSSLLQLELENNGLGPEGAEAIAHVLTNNDNLKLQLIKVNRNRLENKGATAFAKTFEKMKSLKHIELFQNGIKEEGMASVIQSFKENTDLEVLRINDNCIKKASKDLSEVLPVLTKLTILDISDSLLGNGPSVEIFKVLAKLPKLAELYCNYNEIEKKSYQEEILAVCLSMEALKKVELKGNEINPKIYKKFKKEIENKQTVINCYSDEEEVDLGEDEDEEDGDDKEITKKMEDINLNK